MPLKVETVVNGPFQENCHLVFDTDDMSGIFIDPGAEPERLMEIAKKLGVRIVGIYNTHAHIDHVGGVQAIKDALGVPFALHPDDGPLLKTVPDQARMFGVSVSAVPEIDTPLADGDTVQVGALSGRVIHTPGHSPGGVCFLFGEDLFVGDTLFAGSVGRTDLPGGSTRVLLESIHTRLLLLPDDVRVYSGHGPNTTIGRERIGNPFLNGRI